MFSMMESSSVDPSPDHAAALRDADASRVELAGRVDPGRAMLGYLGVAMAVHIALVADGIANDRPLVVIGGLLVYWLMAVVQLRHLRRVTGMQVGAFASRVVFGTTWAASTWYVLGLGGAIWAAFESQWLLAALAALVGGAGYAIAGQRWVQRYHADPRDRASWRAELVLGLAATLVGGAILLLQR